MNFVKIHSVLIMCLLLSEVMILSVSSTNAVNISKESISGELPITVHVKFYDYNEEYLNILSLQANLPGSFTMESRLPLDESIFPVKFTYLDQVLTPSIPVTWVLEYATPLEVNDLYTFLQENASLGVRTGQFKPKNQTIQILHGQAYDALALESYFSSLSPSEITNEYAIFMLNLSRFDTGLSYHWFSGDLINNDTSVDMRLGWSAGSHGLFFDPTATEWFSSYSHHEFTRLQDYLQTSDQNHEPRETAIQEYFTEVLTVLTKYSILQIPFYRIPYNSRSFNYAHFHYLEQAISYIDLSIGGKIYKMPNMLHELMPYTQHNGRIYRAFINQGIITSILFSEIQALLRNETSKQLIFTSNSINQLRNDVITYMNLYQEYSPPIIIVFDFVLEPSWKIFMKNKTNGLIPIRSPIPFTGVIDLTAYSTENRDLPPSQRVTQVQRLFQEYGSIFGLNLINEEYGWAGYIHDPMTTYDQDGSTDTMEYSCFNKEALARYQAIYWNVTTRGNMYLLEQEMLKLTNRVFSMDFSNVKALLEQADSLVQEGKLVQSVSYYWNAWETLVNETQHFVDNKVLVVNTISLSLISITILLLVMLLRDISFSDLKIVKLVQQLRNYSKK